MTNSMELSIFNKRRPLNSAAGAVAFVRGEEGECAGLVLRAFHLGMYETPRYRKFCCLNEKLPNDNSIFILTFPVLKTYEKLLPLKGWLKTKKLGGHQIWQTQ